MSRTEELVNAAFRLSQASPTLWLEFLEAFDGYVADTTKKLVSAEPVNLANYQGQAVQALHIFNLFADSRKTVQNAEAKRNARRSVESPPWPSR